MNNQALICKCTAICFSFPINRFLDLRKAHWDFINWSGCHQWSLSKVVHKMPWAVPTTCQLNIEKLPYPELLNTSLPVPMLLSKVTFVSLAQINVLSNVPQLILEVSSFLGNVEYLLQREDITNAILRKKMYNVKWKWMEQAVFLYQPNNWKKL